MEREGEQGSLTGCEGEERGAVGSGSAHSKQMCGRREDEVAWVEGCMAVVDKKGEERIAGTRKDIVVAYGDVERNVGSIECEAVKSRVGSSTAVPMGEDGEGKHSAVGNGVAYMSLKGKHGGVACGKCVNGCGQREEGESRGVGCRNRERDIMGGGSA